MTLRTSMNHQTWLRDEKQHIKLMPQPFYPYVRFQVARQGAVSAIGIAIEADVLLQKVLEGGKQRRVPARTGQHGREQAFQSTILVAGDAGGLHMAIRAARPCQVHVTSFFDTLPALGVKWRELKSAPHEFVMVHPLARDHDIRPW